MKLKKFFLIFVFILLIAIIGFLLIKVNEKSEEKIVNISGNESSTSKEEIKENNKEIVQITDNYFIQQTNDIYVNSDEYIGRTIKIEGLIYTYEDSEGKTLYAVTRNTPGCCGNDGIAGLDIRYNGTYPEKGTWVEVTGIIGKENINGEDLPTIKVSTMNEKEKGVTFVTN